MSAVIKFFVSYLTIISVIIYSLGQAQREGIITHFKLSLSAYHIDLLPGLWQGGILLFTWSILPFFIGLTSAIALAFTTDVAKEILPQKTYMKLASIINNSLDKNYESLQLNSKWKIFFSVLSIFIILILFFLTLEKATKAGEKEALDIEKKLNSKESLVQVFIDSEPSPITGIEIVSGSSFTSFLTSSGAITTSNDSIKKITYIPNEK